MSKVLIIDDEENLRKLLARIIRLEGFTIVESNNLKNALKSIDKEDPEIILCDVKLPDGNGIDFVKEVKSKNSIAEIILLTAYGNIPDGIQAMKNGAFDYIVKGNDNDKVIPLIYRALEKVDLKKRIALLEKQVGKKYNFESIIGSAPSILNAIELAKKVSLTDTTVLLLGETGTGKEIFAQAIHNAGKRAGNLFLALNCGTFSKDLLESEIFGHKAGAFTGAIKDKKGLIEEANKGTLFLDEIGEIPYELQSKLLRVLETNEFIKVGDITPTKINVRFIAATNRDLQQDVNENKFREDLFYRLNVFTISLPSLHERKKDIPSLANFFLKVFSAKTGNNITGMNKRFLELLEQQEWKGNIRELKNTIERAVILCNGSELTPDDLPLEMRTSNIHSQKNSTAMDLSSVEKAHIQKVLMHTHGNKTEAARLLNIGLTTLYRKIEEYNL